MVTSGSTYIIRINRIKISYIMRCTQFYKKVEEKIGAVFYKLGFLIATHPWKVILVFIFIAGACGLGLLRIKPQSDVETAYTPMTSRAKDERERLKSLFKDHSGTNFFEQSLINTGSYGEVIVKTKTGGNILNSNLLTEIQNINDSIWQFTIKDQSGNTYTFNDICALRNHMCVVDGDFVSSTTFQHQFTSNNVTYPYFENKDLRTIFGNVSAVKTIIKSASMIKLRYNLRQDQPKYETLAKEWEKQFISNLKSLTTNKTSIAFANSKSLDTELNANIGGDIVLFSLTFTLMIVYSTFATTSFRCVADRQHLGRAGVLTVGLGILAAFGITALCGAEFVDIVGVMPFLVLGVGLDNMFILLSGLSDAPFEKSPEERVAETMRTSGVAITITSITDIIAFGIGASSIFLSVRNFCIYTAVAIGFAYIAFVTFFPACMAINEKRMADNRHCCFCHVIPTKEEIRVNDDLVVCLCSGSKPNSRQEADGFLEWYPPIVFEKMVSSTIFKVMTILTYLGFIGVAGYGISQFKQGLVLSTLVNEKSYYYTFSELSNQYFFENIPVAFVTDNQQNYLNKDVADDVKRIQKLAIADKDIQKLSSLNWLTDYQKSSFYDNSSVANFILNLRTKFLPSRPFYINDVVFDSSNTSIVASRFFVFINNIKDSQEQGDLMIRMRDIADSSSIHMFAFSPSFIFYEQYVAIFPSTMKTVGIAAAVVLVVTAIFMPAPLMVLYVTVSVVMIMFGLFGFMTLWGLSLSSITMIHVIMSVGFSVDFSAHICHAFLSIDEPCSKKRVQKAIRRAGGPIFNGAMSSIIGIILLISSKSFIFRSFFKVMLLVVLFGMFHALFVLPVILSFSCSKPSNQATASVSKVELKEKD